MASTAAERARQSAGATTDTASALHTAMFKEAGAAPEPRGPIEDAADAARTARGSSTVKRVRRTLDLPRARHHQAKRWQNETADELGEVEITGQDLGEALFTLLVTDETTARKVKAELKRMLGTR